MAARKPVKIVVKDVPADASLTAQAALDSLDPGNTIFSIGAGWELPEMAPHRDFHLGALIDLLRSEEEIPRVVRDALADALDREVDAPVKLSPKRGSKRVLASTLFRKAAWATQGLPLYEKYRAEGMSSSDAYDRCAKELGTDPDTLKKLLSAARRDRAVSEQVGRMMQDGESVEDIAAFIQAPNHRVKRGRPAKKG